MTAFDIRERVGEILAAAAAVGDVFGVKQARVLNTMVSGPSGARSGIQTSPLPSAISMDPRGAPVAGSTGANQPGEATSGACDASLAITTVMPWLVVANSFSENAYGRRTQPCDAGYPGMRPACSATPSQVSRCMNGIGALS